jgi:hypothetical protein
MLSSVSWRQPPESIGNILRSRWLQLRHSWLLCSTLSGPCLIGAGLALCPLLRERRRRRLNIRLRIELCNWRNVSFPGLGLHVHSLNMPIPARSHMEKRFVSCAASETFYFVAPDLSSQIGPKKTILILPILSFRSWFFNWLG